MDFYEIFAGFAGFFGWSYDEIMNMTQAKIERSYRAMKIYATWNGYKKK